MSDSSKLVSVIVDSSGAVRGGTGIREAIPIEKLSAEIKDFVGNIGSVLNEVARSATGGAKLEEVEVSASIEVGGKLSLLGSGVETKGEAGISFKFVFPEHAP